MLTDQQRSEREWFCNLGLQYYIAGRWMAHAGVGFVPVAGNTLHHAVEMFIKSVLVEHLSIEAFKRRQLRHNLVNLWTRLKQSTADPLLDRFDTTVEQLHDFAQIRYPEKITTEGFQIIVNAGGRPFEPIPKKLSLFPHSPGYQLSISNIDDLVVTMLMVNKVTPGWWVTMFSDEARRALLDRNARAAAWEKLIADWKQHVTWAGSPGQMSDPGRSS